MEAREVKDINQARKIVEQRGLGYIKVGVFDMDGVMRGKYMSKEKFLSSSTRALVFVMWSWAGT